MSDRNGLEIGTVGRPTNNWTRADHEGKLVIDQTLVNGLIMKGSILADDYPTGSDHVIGRWQLGVDWEKEVDDKMEVGWNSAATIKNYAEAVENLAMGVFKESAHLDVDCIEAKMKLEGRWCEEEMSSVSEARATIFRICAKSKT